MDSPKLTKEIHRRETLSAQIVRTHSLASHTVCNDHLLNLRDELRTKMKLGSTKTTLLLPILAGLSACVPSPEKLESEPVTVQTPKGAVTCQLYTRNTVIWDRAIDFPATKMSVAEADAYCKQEGQRLLQ